MTKLPKWVWAMAALLVGLGGLGTALLTRSQTRRQQAFAARMAKGARDSARDGLRARLEVLAGEAASFASFNQVRALAFDVPTLRDGFQSEAWWQPARAEFRIYGVALAGDELDLIEGEGMAKADLDVAALVRSARSEGKSSGVVPARSKNNWPYLVAAGAIDSPGKPRPAVLVLARPFDEGIAKELAARVGGPVVLHDGHSTLLAVGDGKEQLQAVADRGEGSTLTDDEGRWAVARQELAPGLFLWTRVQTDGHVADEAGDALAPKLVLWSLIVLGLAACFSVARRQARAPLAPASDPLTTPPSQPALSSGLSLQLATTPSMTPPLGTGVGPSGSTGPHAAAEEGVTAVSLPAATPLPTNANVFGRYVLLDRLGEGGMAEIYTAVTFGAENFRRTFVVKRLRPEMAREPSVVSAFIDEANLASTLVHSNIVPVFDFGKVGDEYFLAQEYILGRDLGRITRRALELEGKPIPAAQVFFVASETLKALEYAHGRIGEGGRPMGIVHRDVSPNNILVSARGEVKLFDFGIAKADGRITQTQHGVVKGNVRFMSPEQARGIAIDSRADLFSLGLVLYYAIAGEALYQGENSYELLMRAAQGPGSEEAAKILALPDPASRILRRVLQAEPDARFQTAAEFATALSPYLSGAAAALSRTMERLFATDIREEEAKFAAAVSTGSTGAHRAVLK